MALDTPGMSDAAFEAPIIFHDLTDRQDLNFLYVQTQSTCEQFAADIAAHALLFDAWCALLCQTAHQYTTYEIHPADGPSAEWQFRVANLATDWLCACAPYITNPTIVADALPDDWPLLRFCRMLVPTGRMTPEITARAMKLCADKMNVIVSNICGERDLFLYAMRDAGLLPSAFSGLVEDRSPHSESKLTMLNAEVNRTPDRMLELLHAQVDAEIGTPILWGWASESTAWQPVLLGHVYRRAFSVEELSLQVCRDMCEQVLTAVQELPPSRLRAEYQSVYRALQAFCHGSTGEPLPTEFGEDVISQSHRVSIEVIRAFEHAPQPHDSSWFEQWTLHTNGWIKDKRHRLKDGNVSRVYGYDDCILYFPPALRLALAVASIHSHRPDFLSGWVTEQYTVQALFTEGVLKYAFHPIYQHGEEQRKQERYALALQELNSQISHMPRNVRLRAALGHVLILLDRLEEARDVLEVCSTSAWYDAEDSAGARYNLACCYALRGDAERCRVALEQSLPGLPHMGRRQVENDRDFDSVRGEQWFVNLVAALPDLPYWG
jgi:hypothetical protein